MFGNTFTENWKTQLLRSYWWGIEGITFLSLSDNLLTISLNNIVYLCQTTYTIFL